MAFGIRTRRRQTQEARSHVVLQVAALLIAIGAIMKLYQMQSHKADDRAFQHIRSEISDLDISRDAKETLRGVTKLAAELTSEARAEQEQS